MKKFLFYLAAFTCVATLSLSFFGCGSAKPAKNDDSSTASPTENGDIFKYDSTENQNAWVITGIEKENGDGILEIPEMIEEKPVTEILSLDYRPNNEEKSLHFTEIKCLKIPQNIKFISPYLCRNMLGLQEVVFSEESLVEKLEGTFQGCKNLHSIHLPTSLKQIFSQTFEDCEALTCLALPKSVKYISAISLKNSGIVDLAVDLENAYFSAVNNVLYDKQLTQLIYYPEKKPEEEFTVLDSVTEISVYAFSNCKALKRIDLNNVEIIRKMSFAGCENLAEITAENLKYVDGEYVFDETAWYKNYQGGEISLGKVLLSYKKFAFALDLSGYVSIAPYAFKGHTDLHRITFDYELTSIGNGAFMDCVNLYEVIFNSRAIMVFIGSNVFENNAPNRYFKVYKSLFTDNPNNFNNYANNIFWQPYKDSIRTFE